MAGASEWTAAQLATGLTFPSIGAHVIRYRGAWIEAWSSPTGVCHLKVELRDLQGQPTAASGHFLAPADALAALDLMADAVWAQSLAAQGLL